MLEIVLPTIWFIFPAYVANSVAVDVSGVPYLREWKTPVDLGRSWRGKRILGDGKTWRGLFCGTVAAVFAGYLQGLHHGWGQGVFGAGIVEMNVFTGFLLGFGALFGDISGSFLKRRAGFERGRVAPLLDQADFLIGAFLFASIAVRPGFEYFIVAILVTIPIHLFGNFVAWVLKLKKDPW